MRKFFAWFLMISGFGNFTRGIAMIASGVTETPGGTAGGAILFGLATFGIGLYLLRSRKK